jgi:hypothetical protein
MVLPVRDRQIITLTDRFKQLSSSHIQSLVFAGNASGTPCDRALKRLVEHKFLARIERRTVGGGHGGSGQYVYQLGRAGWDAVGREGRYYASTAVNYHSLAIADVFVSLKQAEQAGWLSVLTYATEPDCWATIAGYEVKPDLFVDMSVNGRNIAHWLEVDLGTERQAHIKAKCDRYWHAFQRADGSEWPVFPLVVFLVADEARKREIQSVIDRMPKLVEYVKDGPDETLDPAGLFKVVEQASYPQVLR